MGVQHADIDLLTLSCALLVAKCREYADAPVEPGEEIGDRHTDLLRKTLRLAGETHDTAHGLYEAVIARTRRVGAGLSEAGDRAVDQAGEFCMELFVAKAVFRQRAHFEVLDQNIALRDQVARDRLAFRLADIERDRAFI